MRPGFLILRWGNRIATDDQSKRPAFGRRAIGFGKEMPATTAARAHQARSRQFADMIVHGLSGPFHGSGDGCRGIGLEEGGENLQPQGMMEQAGGLCSGPLNGVYLEPFAVVKWIVSQGFGPQSTGIRDPHV
jgi:hypothetical protein